MHATFRRAVAATVATMLVMIATLSGPAALAAPTLADPAPADVTAVASLEKTASVVTVAPGGTFFYTLTVGCSSITDTGCRDAVLTDEVPAPFEVVSAVVGAGVNSASDPVIVGNTVTVDWTTPLGDGSTGILDATTGIVEIEVRLPENVSYDVSGVPVTNSAVLEGANFTDVDAQVAVTPEVPLALSTTAEKVLSPESSVSTAGTAVSASLIGTNASNATVDSLTLQDPVDPAALGNPFEYLGFSGFGAVTAPPGADAALTVYEVFVGGAWVLAVDGALPQGVAAADVRGTRVSFHGSIPAGAGATVVLELELTDAAAGQPDGFTVTNTLRSSVTLDGESASSDTSADFTLYANTIRVRAGKSFDAALVVAGQTVGVDLEAENMSQVPLETLELREPSTGSFPNAYRFAGFTEGIEYPRTASSGVVIYHFAGGQEAVPFDDGDTPAGPSGVEAAEVQFFEIVFEGPILPGAETIVSFDVETDEDLGDTVDLPTAVPNEVLVTGTNQQVAATSVANDQLYIYAEVIETYIDKVIRPTQILAVPGQVATVSLQGGLTERPSPPDTVTGSTGSAQRIVLQDPIDPAGSDAWWNAFDLTSIAQTPVPAGATLTIEYYDESDDSWKTLVDGIVGPTIYADSVAADVRAVAGGIRFVYEYTGADGLGFAPGTDLAPNFTVALRADGRYSGEAPFADDAPTFVPNCAQSGADAVTGGVASAAAVMPAEECPEIELVPVDPGSIDLIDKDFGRSSSGGEKSVIARSANTIPSTLSWSTGGYSGFERVEITDVASPDGTPIAQSVYDAFNLRRIDPVTPATDPLIAFDQVTGVDLWIGGTWVSAANDPCPDSCIGQFPGMNLTSSERNNATGVRLTFAESPDRAIAIAGDPSAPAVGSGVARSSGNDRPLTLVWEIRDVRRSDGEPALGDVLYNLPAAGTVRNTARADGFPADGGPTVRADDSDDAIIIDVPVTTTTTKNWEGGPLAVPPSTEIPDAAFPHSRITVTTRNTTPARVDQLVITDPAPGSVTDRRLGPFDGFVLTNFHSITNPGGAVTGSTVITLFCPDGSTVDYSRAEALALVPSTMPCDVTGVQVSFEGRISANAAGVVSFDVRLRPNWRGTAERVSIPDSPIFNTAEGVVADIDPIGDCPPPRGARWACDQGGANIALSEPTFGITATKDITASSQKADEADPVTVTLGALPSGSARTRTATLSDSDPSFWNAFDFVGMDPSWDFVQPVGRVQACYLDGGSFSPEAVASDAVGGEWTCQPTTDQSIEAATAFLADAPDDIHGVRFQFWQASDIGFQNPMHPYVTVPFLVERRTELRSGGPVPTTRADQVPAPGESQAGVFTDTVEVHSDSAPLAPGLFLTAEATADDEYRHLHLEAEVSVTKSPTGHVRPGRPIPFRLEFTNTGEATLHDPVFSDRLPVDAEGRQLILDPDRDPTVSPYTFTLSGPTPSDPASALPTDADEVVIEEIGDTIFFRMPEGAVLEPGQTYTVGASLMLRPGLMPTDQAQNWAAIGVTEPLDGCVPLLDPETGECIDDAIVSPLAVPALSTVKYVRADSPHEQPGIPEVRSVANHFDCADAADSDGFFRAPCIPVTVPGDTETWRFRVTNAGTLPMDQLVSIDNLPTPGDQGLIVTLPRESAWEPTLVSSGALVGGPDGAVLRTFASTSSTPCIADLNPLGAPCASGGWIEVTAATDLTTVRSLKFVIDFADGRLFEPGDAATVQFQTRTTPSERLDDAFPIAWNTVMTGGSAVSVAGPVTVPATEGRRVGISYATGQIAVRKIVSGPAQELAPAEFPVQLECTADGRPVDGVPEVVLTSGAAPTVVDGLPLGAECTASEGQFGQTETRVVPAVVGGPDDEIGVVSVENVYDVAALTVRKVVDTSAVDTDGDPVAYGPFRFVVECVFDGRPVYATGYGPDQPMMAELTVDEIWSLDGLAVGSHCAVGETDDLGALSTSMDVDGVVTEGTIVELDIRADRTVGVTATNRFGAGSLAVEKEVVGDGADEYGTGPFVFSVDCTLDTGDGPASVWSGSFALGGTAPLARTLRGIAAGAECVVEEVEDGGATSTSISGSPAVIGLDETVGVSVTNTFDAGSIRVVKNVEGDGAALWGAGPFEVALECVDETGESVDVPGGAVRILSPENGYATSFGPLLVGTSCTVAETETGGATTTAITDSAGEVVDAIEVSDGETEITVTNTFDVQSLIVTKTVSGGDASEHREDAFEVTVSCVWNGAGIEIPGGAQRTLRVGVPARYEDLPVGASCRVTESDRGGADGVTITPAAPTDSSTAVVEIVAEADAEVAIDNRFDAPLPPGGPDEPLPPGGPEEPLPPSGPDAPLASTGSDGSSVVWLAIAAALLMTVGALAVGWSRRRSRE